MNARVNAAGAFLKKHVETITFVLVVLFALKILFGLMPTLDIGLEDETDRLHAGYKLWRGLPLSSAEASPFYTMWYRLLAVLQPAPAKLYYLQWFVTQLGLALALFWLARRSGASLITATTVFLVWILSFVLLVYPYTPFFSTLLFALAAIAATYMRDRFRAAALLAVVTTLAAFVRPELWTAAIVFGALVAGAAAYRRRFALAIVPLVALALARLAFGSPLAGNRAIFAFGQHYAMNRIEDGHLALSCWTDWEPILRASFPHAQTLGDAIKENPSAFLWHAEYNLLLLGPTVKQLMTMDGYVPRLVPVGGVVTLLLFGALAQSFAGWVLRRDAVPAAAMRWLPVVFPIALAGGAAIVMIRPREHYLVPIVFFGLSLIAVGAARARALWPGRRLPSFLAPLALLLLLACTPTAADNMPALLPRRTPPPRGQETVHTIEAMQRLGLKGHITVLEPNFSRAFYAYEDWGYYAFYQKDEGFDALLARVKPDVVVMTWVMREDTRYRSDPEFKAFETREGALAQGYDLVPVPGENVVLGVKRSR